MSEDSIWVKLKKEFIGTSEDVYIGTYYVSPENSKSKSGTKHDFGALLNEEICYFSKKGTTLVQGDLNARTGNLKDFIEPDKHDFEEHNDLEEREVEMGSELIQNVRNSEDKNDNKRGKELIDFCKSNDMLIINGRKIGDTVGKFTSHQYNGSAVVDYFISPNWFSRNISLFKVGQFIPWLSDHCPIHTTLTLTYTRQTNDDKTMTDIHPGFIWDMDAKAEYEKGLKSAPVEERIQNLLNNQSNEPIHIAGEIRDILLKNCTDSNIKKKKNRTDGNNNEPWFDKECKNSKDNIRKLGKTLRKDPKDKGVRSELMSQKKTLKKMVRRKKLLFKKETVSKMKSIKNNDAKQYWKLFKKLSKNQENGNKNVQPHTFSAYFESLLASKTAGKMPTDCTDNGKLDFQIEHDELKDASSKILKAGKGHGIDIISNEMIKILVDCYPEIILKLFNAILKSGKVLPQWILGLIVPIHKKGSKSVPANYRGITLMSCLGKLFLSILNARLLKYALDNKILSKKQLGFLAGNRCSDAHIIINNMIRKYCHNQGKKIFCSFIDFSKAFDTVPRDILLDKLKGHGITGCFFNIIKNIYSNDKACIKMQSQLTNPFQINMGVRQGCVLSPLLFNIFLSDLAKQLDSLQDQLKIGEMDINTIFWADDIIMFAKDENKLREMLNILEVYSEENKLTVNTDKTKTMVFNKTGRLMRRAFYLNGVLLESVRSYKYLGFVLTPSGEISSGLNDLKDRAFKAFMKIKNDLGVAFYQDILTSLTLIDTLVKPVLMYNSDFWGCMKLSKNNPIDTFHLKMCKQLLGVNKDTTTAGVLLELGRIPLCTYGVKNAIKNWERIRKGNANPVLLASFNEAANENLLWLETIRKTFEENEMIEYFTNAYNGKEAISKKIFKRIEEKFHEEALNGIRGERSKLRTYALFKNKPGLEKYLLDIKNTDVRKQVTKFRLSDHKLRIETGRVENINAEHRYCPFCLDKVETEAHMLLACPIYEETRSLTFSTLERDNAEFTSYNDNEKIIFIMKNISPAVSKFIFTAFELRTFLLSKPKRNS